jgi:lipoprotein-releasing system permease protein
MVVMEKQKEIAILRAMGAAKDQVMKAFMIEGLIIGFVGTTAGTVLGLATCLALDRWRFIPLDTDVYYLDTLPVVLNPWTFVGVASFAIAVSFLATLYPSWNAAEVDPVEGLRYE